MVEIREVAEPKSEESFYRCGLAVTLRRRGADLHLLTSDLSFQGAFVRTDEAPPDNSLVRLVFTLPPDDTSLALSAHVVRVVKPGASKDDQYPGFHARFIGLNGPPKARWESVIWSLKRDHKQSVHTTVNFTRPSYLNLMQQKVAETASVRWRPTTVEDLARIVREDIPSGTIFVASSNGPAPGTKVSVELVHPITGELLALQGVVRRRGGGGGGTGGATEGVLVALAPLIEDARAALTEMVESVHIIPDYDVDLFDKPSLVIMPGAAP